MELLKSILPNRIMSVPVLAGPFRGARVQMNPRHSLRKMLGIYEHELNDWIVAALPRVTTVLDVGAAEGYFSLGCAAAFRRMRKAAEIVAFEPEAAQLSALRAAIARHSDASVKISVRETYVGKEPGATSTTLDEVAKESQLSTENALIKIDVEGAEVDVIDAASAWLNPSNRFLIEVHWDPSFLEQLTARFARRGLRLRQIDQRPLPVLGYEARGRDQWWLVSDPV